MRYLTVAATLVAAHALSSAAAAEETPDTTFELVPADVSSATSDSQSGLSDVKVAGRGLGSAFDWWPSSLVVAPVPGYSPQLGWSLALGGAWFFGKQERGKAAPSMAGAFAFKSDNGSVAYGAGAKFRLKDDKYRITAGAGYGDVRYRFYGIGNSNNQRGLAIDIQQEAPAYIGSFSARVWRRAYIGLGYLWSDVATRPRLTITDGFADFDPVVDLDMAAVILPIEWDSRDHVLFPRKGWLVESNTKFYRKDVGSDFDATTSSLAINKYFPVGDADVFALRGYFRSSSGDAPFFLLSTFGGGTDLRGYPAGRYRDKMMYALQGEYRWQFARRWILTGFAGVGEVAADWESFGSDFLPATGLGLRFVLSDEHKMSLSLDAAAGSEGYEFYFGVGEAF